jgi:hypothetical protein
VSFFTDGKVEIMFKLSYEQAENLDRLMKGRPLNDSRTREYAEGHFNLYVFLPRSSGSLAHDNKV